MQDWWRGGVIYQVYPRSFQDSDGDGIGDLPGIIQRLDYIASLGVDAIWLSPIFSSPQADMGYDVSDYCDIDPLFGSLQDFDTLIARAHALGLKIIIDQVLSHTSDQHAWFEESSVSRTNARADWYVWADPKPDGTPPNNWPSVFGGSAWEWHGTRRQYYLHNFLISQPDLNYHNPAVQDAALDVMRFWLERGVDGFRFDTANYYFHDAKLRSNPRAKRAKHLPYATSPYDMQEHRYSKSQPENVGFFKKVRALLDQFPNTTSVGEVGDNQKGVALMAEYTSGGDKLHMCYSFDMLGPKFSAEHFRSKLAGFFDAGGGGWPCWSFSNHDVSRHATRWLPFAVDADDLARQSAALLLSLKGSVCLYQGEELGLPESELLFEELTDPPGIRFWPDYKGRDGCRTPMPWDEGAAPNGFTTGKPWLPLKAPQSARSVAAQEANPNGVLGFYRQALALRKAHPALITGDIEFFATREPVLAFRRTSGAERIVCAFNLSAEPVRLVVSGEADLLLAQNVTPEVGGIVLGPSGFAYYSEPAGAAGLVVKSRARTRTAKAA